MHVLFFYNLCIMVLMIIATIFLISLLSLILGFVTLRQNPNDLINRSFFWLIIFLVLWAITNYFTDYSDGHNIALFFGRSTYFTSLMLAYFFLNFANLFPKPLYMLSRVMRVIIFTLPVTVAFLSFTDLIVKNVVLTPGVTHIINGELFGVFGFIFPLYMLGGLLILIKKLFLYKGREREQVRYLFLGFFLSTIIASLTNFILPLITGANPYAKYGPFGSVFLIGFTTYAIVAHRLFDIRVIIKRTVVFTGLSAFVLGTYIVIIFSAATLAGTGGQAALTSRQLIPNLLAALAIAVGFEPLRRWLTVRTDKWLFKGEYTPDEVLRSLSDTLANVIDLVEALDGMMQLVVKSMRLHRAVAFIVQPGENEGEYELKRAVQVNMANKASQLQLAPKDALLQYFIQTRVNKAPLTPVVTEELIRAFDEGLIKGERAQVAADLISRLEQFGAAVALPLFLTRQQPVPSAPGSPTRYRDVESLVGVLLLGEKKSGDAFTDQDLKLLEILSNQTAAAVEKARFFEEDQLKSEFVSIASHELLTPTAAMEGYLSMILEEDMGKVDDKARGYLEKVFAESKRLASLVKDLLNVSRIERGKIVVNVQPIELIPLITTTIENLQIKAKERGLKLTFDAPKTLPKVMADPEKLTEVVMNIAGNGLKYTTEGAVTVSVEVKGNQVLVHTKDSGIGMKPADVQHLFTKFFRASNSDETGQTGTGLGLYISKHVIELMGGTLAVTSELGKGSTFTFSLPVAK